MKVRLLLLFVVTLSVFVLASNLSNLATAAGQEKDATVEKDDQTLTLDCNATSLTVSGDDNKLTIRGQCTRLTVSGDDNVIQAATVNELTVSGDDNNINVDAVAKITTTGSDNNIQYKTGIGGKNPDVSSKGEDNNIKQRN
jgi:hypothetical protein